MAMDNDDDWIEEEEGTCSSCVNEVSADELDENDRCEDCALEVAQNLKEQMSESHD